MFMRFTRSVVLDVWNYDIQKGEQCKSRCFGTGEVHLLGETSEESGSSVIELVGVGYVEVENDAWVEDERIRHFFDPNELSRN